VFRADPQHSGVYTSQADYGEWTFNAGSPIASSPVLAGDVLYFGTMTGVFYALDPGTQKVLWQVALPEAVFSSPAVTNESVYVGGLDGNLYALDAKTGEQRWKFSAKAPVFSSPAVDHGSVYFGSIDSYLYSLDASTGELHWKTQTQGEIVSSPLVVDGKVIVGSGDSFLYALAAESGEVDWMYMAEGGIQSSPVCNKDIVYIGSVTEGNSAHAIDLESGKKVWRLPAGMIVSSLAASGDEIFGANVSGDLMAAQAADGSPVWTYPCNSPVFSSPAILADQVLFGAMDGKLYALDRKSGKEQWSFQTHGEIWASPAVAGNTVFIGSTDGYLYALDRNSPELALAPTPTALSIEPTPTMMPEPPQPTQLGSAGLPWWNERVFYEVFVRSFKDSDGDGIGDLQGLIEKLDYLNDGDPATTSDLGVTGIWLMPVAQSPSYHGYDISDYRTIEEDYGSNADFQELVGRAHQRGMVVIVDMVMNHTSSEHPWFVQASKPGSTTENWYIWSPTDPGYNSPWDSPVWHRGRGGDLENMRTYHALTDYFYGLFWEGMPDLNYNNGAVTNEMFDILRYWLDDMGADGFRLDAVRHLIEDGEIQENTPATHAWLQNFDHFVHTVKPDALTVGEIWDDSVDVAPYVPDEVDIAFEFKLAEAIIQSINDGENSLLLKQMQQVLDTYPEGQFAPFLTNHDMTRVMTQLQNNPAKAKLAAALVLTSPGVPFIYYGEEIGLTGTKPEDINVRTPMQWDASSGVGFTTGTPWVAPNTKNPAANVAAQSSDPASLLNWYASLIHLRQAHTALSTGDAWVVQTDVPHVFALLRISAGDAVLLLVNLSDQPVDEYALALDASSLTSGVTASLLLDQSGAASGRPGSPSVDAQGGFKDYTPLSSLLPYQAVLIGLK
jgi:glycosidase/outer membrane protein assembly factor BamB